jgi:Lsr2
VARKVRVELSDDLDGSPATQTLRFGFRGVDYELDLSDENANEMTHWLEHYISHARRIGGRAVRSDAPSVVDTKGVRAWALEAGIPVSARGRVSREIVEQYERQEAGD